MSNFDDLLPLLDNGGNRSYVERRREVSETFIRERRSNKDRRKVADRRKVPNQKRKDGLERRLIFIK